MRTPVIYGQLRLMSSVRTSQRMREMFAFVTCGSLFLLLVPSFNLRVFPHAVTTPEHSYPEFDKVMMNSASAGLPHTGHPFGHIQSNSKGQDCGTVLRDT